MIIFNKKERGDNMDINNKIKEIKTRIKDITKNFPYTEYEINILTICYLTIASIDNDITDILDEVLSRIFILFNYGEFDEFLEYLGLDLEEGGGFVVPGFDLTKKDNYEFIYININKTKEAGEFNIGYLLLYLIHELKHAINGIVNSYRRSNDSAYLISGLNEYEYEVNKETSDILLDEAFNCFITDVYLEQLSIIKKHNIEDEEIKSILNGFNFDWQGVYPYDCTYLLEPLFCDVDFF